MNTVNIYEVKYKVDIHTSDVQMNGLEQIDFIIGEHSPLERVSTQWNLANVSIDKDSISVSPYMEEVYIDNNEGYVSLFKVTSVDGQKKYFSVLATGAGAVHRFIKENHLLEDIVTSEGYYVSYENCKIIM